MNRNRPNYTQRPSTYQPQAQPQAPPRPKTPNPAELNEQNFPFLGDNRGPNQVHVFDTSFAKRIEQTKQIEEIKRLREERIKEDRIKAQLEMSGIYMLNLNRSSSSNRYYESEEEEEEEERPYQNQNTDDDGWTTVKNTKLFKPKHTLSVEELYIKHKETEERNEPELHTTEEGDDLIEFGYRHSHG